MWPVFLSGLVAGFFNGLYIWAKNRAAEPSDEPDLDESLRRDAKEALRSVGISGVESLRDLLRIDPTLLPPSVREVIEPLIERAREALRRAPN
jgi:hypothetical protein